VAAAQARRDIGMVFQEYNLVERLSVMENLLCGRLGFVSAPARPGCASFRRQDIERAFELLKTVGLGSLCATSAPMR
jgi:phosphonate transport system ATP-binding protein